MTTLRIKPRSVDNVIDKNLLPMPVLDNDKKKPVKEKKKKLKYSAKDVLNLSMNNTQKKEPNKAKEIEEKIYLKSIKKRKQKQKRREPKAVVKMKLDDKKQLSDWRKKQKFPTSKIVKQELIDSASRPNKGIENIEIINSNKKEPIVLSDDDNEMEDIKPDTKRSELKRPQENRPEITNEQLPRQRQRLNDDTKENIEKKMTEKTENISKAIGGNKSNNRTTWPGLYEK